MFNMRIKIEKVKEVKGGLPANQKQNHIDGQEQDETYSLPLEYTIEGELVGKISKGNSVIVMRDTRNGVKMPGWFSTSAVTKVTKNRFHTQNSVYNYKFL